MSGENFSVNFGNGGTGTSKVDNDSPNFGDNSIEVNDSEQELRIPPTRQDIRNESPQLKEREKVVLSKGGFGKSMRTLYNKLSAKTETGRKRRQENAQNYLKLVDEVVKEFGFDSLDSVSIQPGTELHSNWIGYKAGHGRNAEVAESTKNHIMRDLKEPVIFALLGEFAKKYGKNFDSAKDPNSVKEILAQIPQEISAKLEECLNDPNVILGPELVDSFRRQVSVDLIKQDLDLSNVYGDESNFPEELTKLFNVAGNVSEKIFKIDKDKFLAYTQNIIKSDLATRNGAYIDQALNHIGDLLSKAGVSKDDSEIKAIFEEAEKAKTSNYLLSKDNNWLTELNKKFELHFKPVRENNANIVNLVKQRLDLSDIYGDDSNLPEKLIDMFVEAKNDIKPVKTDELLSEARNILKIDLAKRNGEYVDKIINNTRAFLGRIGLKEENNDFKISLNESGQTIEDILAEAEKSKESKNLLSKNNDWLNAFNKQINKAVFAIVPKKNQ